jgi:hypothetical protein
MTKKTFLGAMTVVTAVALTGTALVASNMGFKLNYTLAAPGAAPDAGTTTIALPDNRQTGLNDAKNLMDDIGFANVVNVQKYIKSSDSLAIYTGRKGTGPVFALAAGEGYRVKMQTTVNYIIVGSDDPSLAYSLAAPGAAPDAGTTQYAYNYHQTATDSKALMDDIGFANVVNIQKYIKSSDSLAIYTGRKGTGPVFALVPGEAYRVKMQTTVNYVPSHY